jgi:hypothetical protein
VWNLKSNFSMVFLTSLSLFLSVCVCYVFQMGFIQLNEDFLFIEPFNDTMAIIGHPHRLYRQKRSTEEKVTENSAVHRHHCGVISGN